MTHILKFGGTSVGSPESLENVVRVIRERARKRRVVVVVSALSGVTSALDAAASLGDISIVDALYERHTSLLPSFHPNGVLDLLRERLPRRAPRHTPDHDAILGAGERLAAPLLAEILRSRGIDATSIDATEVVRTDDSFGSARVDLTVTRRRLHERLTLLGNGVVPVITGYVGATEDGTPTTLGRGGSDITAAVVGAALDADEVEIWSDVDGIYSSDPRTSHTARLLPRLTHDEALRLARGGAKVLHPDAIPPLAQRGIRLSIRNTFAPQRRGTEIGGRPPRELVIAGATGKVGSALVRQLRALEPNGVRIRILANSTSMNDARACSAVATNWPATLPTLDPSSIFVDCTASSEVASLYDELLERGVGVVTANKLAGSGDAERWRRLRRIAARRNLPLRYETTVGAALPVLRTARELAATGDRLLSLDAVLSGTLSYILGRLHQGIAFSAAVAEARDKGLTEPDPANDLSGLDVGAKLVILLRELGIEPRDVDVEGLSGDDAYWRARTSAAMARGKRLVYVASWRDGSATARVREIDESEPLAHLRAGENVVVFRTARYDSVPLTVSGPGAGPEVTASGLLAEILEVAG